MTGIRLLTATPRIADRLWDLHSEDLQSMTEDELAGYAADQLAPLDPTVSDLQGVVERLITHQHDNARPPDAKPMTADPIDRYFR